MSWLVAQVWTWMALAAVLGALTTFATSLRRVPVERWVPVPVPDAAPAARAGAGAEARDVVAAVAAATRAGATTSGATSLDASPFPPLPGHDQSYRPWEEQELWSRPARLSRPHGTTGPGDAWSEAAASWRSWAEETASRVEEPSEVDDADLFAADREAERLGLEAGVFSTSLEHLLAVREEEPGREADEEEFPYSRPVEAPAYGAGEPGRLSA